VFAVGGVFVKVQNERGRDFINDFAGGKSEHLFGENMVEPVIPVGIQFFHFFAVIQAFDDFRDIQSRFHIQVDERMIGIIKTPRIFVFEQIDHFFNDLFRRKDLVVFLRRNVVENIFLVRFIEVVGEFFLQRQKLFDGIVKDDGIEQVPVKMLCFARFFRRYSRRRRAGSGILSG